MSKIYYLAKRTPRSIDPAFSSVEVSRRSIEQSRNKAVRPYKPGELPLNLYLWKLRMSQRAELACKPLLVTVGYGAAAAAWFALKS